MRCGFAFCWSRWLACGGGWILLTLIVFLCVGLTLAGGMYLWREQMNQPPTYFPRSTEPVQVASIPIQASATAVEPLRVPSETAKPPETWARISAEVYFAALRRSPGYSGKNDQQDVVAEVPAKARVQVLSGPQAADGLNWWYVAWGADQGWMAERTSSGKQILVFGS